MRQRSVFINLVLKARFGFDIKHHRQRTVNDDLFGVGDKFFNRGDDRVGSINESRPRGAGLSDREALQCLRLPH